MIVCVPLSLLITDRYDKLTAKYPTVGCSENNRFGYTLPAGKAD